MEEPFLHDTSSEVPIAVLFPGRGESIKQVQRMRAAGLHDEANELEATIPKPENFPRIVQKERWLDWNHLPADLVSGAPQMLPFPSWEPSYQANMRDFAKEVDSLIIRLQVLPHAVYTSSFFLMLHSERPPKEPSRLSIVRPATEVVRVLRCMLNYMQTSDRHSAVWREHVTKALALGAKTIGDHQKAARKRILENALLHQFSETLKVQLTVYRGVVTPEPHVTEIDPEIAALASAYGEINFDYCVMVIRTLEFTLAQLIGLDPVALARRDMFTPKHPVAIADIDDLLKRHLAEEQIGTAIIVEKPPLSMKNINVECVKRFPLSFRGCLSPYMLFAYLETSFMPKK